MKKVRVRSFSGLYFPTLEILRISPYSGGMWENMDQKISEYRHFLRSDYLIQLQEDQIKKTIFADTLEERPSKGLVEILEQSRGKNNLQKKFLLRNVSLDSCNIQSIF